MIVVENRKEIQQYHIEDLAGQIWLSKSAVGVTGELAGAVMALYRADLSGNLNQSEEYPGQPMGNRSGRHLYSDR